MKFVKRKTQKKLFLVRLILEHFFSSNETSVVEVEIAEKHKMIFLYMGRKHFLR